MTSFGETMLFAVTAAAHIGVVGFALIRLKYAPAVAAEKKGSFQATPMGRASTPETAALAANAEEFSAEQKFEADPVDPKQDI
jgi:hypothetical protein